MLDFINEQLAPIPVKIRYPVLFFLAFLVISVLYIIDVWLLGSGAAFVVAQIDLLKSQSEGPADLTSVNWILQNPHTTALAWLGGGTQGLAAGIKAWWIILNFSFVALIGIGILSNRAQYKNIDYRDIKKIKFSKIKYNLKKQIEKTKKNKYFLALDDRRQKVTIPATKMTEHIHILGGSGSGKTSLAVMPLCLQAIQKGSAVMVIDFKGDKQTIHLLEQEAKKKGKKFFLFSLNGEIGAGCNTYNPLASGTVLSKVERIMTALLLVFDGAAKFYSYVQQSTFIELLKALDKENVKYTISDIYTILNNPNLFTRLTGDRLSEQQIRGLTAALTPFVEISQINDLEPDIDLLTILNNGDVCYFDLQSAETPQVAASLGKMIAMDLQALAAKRNQLSCSATIAIDEFQNMACEAFGNIISKLRSANFAFVLSNQTMGDLRAVSPAFLNTVSTNTATKILFNVEDPGDIAYFAQRAGHVLQTVKSQGKTRRLQGQDLGSMFQLNPPAQTTNQNNVSENISDIETPLIHPNVVARLPFGKTLIFIRGEVTVLGNHVHLLSKTEKDALERKPYPRPEQRKKKYPNKTITSMLEDIKRDAITSYVAPVAPDPEPEPKSDPVPETTKTTQNQEITF